MKPLSIVLLCLFVMAPFLLMMEVRCDSLTAVQSLRTHYDSVLDNAISDAAQQLANHSTAVGYEDDGGMDFDADLAVEMFFSSLCSGLGAQSQYAQDRLRESVPVVVVALRDQAMLYLVRKMENQIIGSQYRHVCVQVVPYTQMAADTKPLVLFSMGPEVRVLNRITGTTYMGDWHQFDEEGLFYENNGPADFATRKPDLFETEAVFSASRMRAVRDAITLQLETGIAVATRPDATGTDATGTDDTGTDATGTGATGTHATGVLNLPVIKDASFRNAVTGVGLFAFVKGLPVGTRQEYQTLAFGGGRVVHREPVTGWEHSGQPRYCSPDCQELLEALVEAAFPADTLRYFSNSQEAAQEGYMPCSHCRP